MRRWAFLVLFFALFGPAILAQDPKPNPEAQDRIDRLVQAIEVIEPDLLRKHLTYIASDEMEGRGGGYPGAIKATRYIADFYQAVGLKPIGDKDEDGRPTYFQHFEFSGRRPRNTIGLLEGSDPKLRNEYVVVGAHHDHVGIQGQRAGGKIGGPKGDDAIWNGADDNGSGTVAVMALAKAFTDAKLRPRRSIIFMTFGAEEVGLVGSRYYVGNPVFPLESHVMMLNMDMIGRGQLQRATRVGGMATARGDILRDAVTRAAEAADLQVSLRDGYGGGSDMASFGARKVPVISVMENGPNGDYHRVTDHADKINYEYMTRVTHMVLLTLVAIADGDDRPVWNDEYQPRRRRRSRGPRLGVNTEALGTEELKALRPSDSARGRAPSGSRRSGKTRSPARRVSRRTISL
jgi:hypothetical protein